MAMFDVIRLERDLPDDGDAGVEYRTNDLKNAGFRYHITFTGQIERIVPIFEAEPKERVELSYHPSVFHASHRVSMLPIEEVRAGRPGGF
jgi:hypothetical protein